MRKRRRRNKNHIAFRICPLRCSGKGYRKEQKIMVELKVFTSKDTELSNFGALVLFSFFLSLILFYRYSCDCMCSVGLLSSTLIVAY